MLRAAPITFGDFRLDVAAERLWRGGAEQPLRAKSFAVLRHLAENRGRLVTKEELFRLCWPKTAVSDTVLRVCIREIRAALDDDAARPTFVTTVGRRGYRFAVDPDAPAAPEGALVGRNRDLARLHAHVVRVETGRRQVVFVTGEPGIGKTALVERFVDEIRDEGSARVALGQCAELAGGREAYLPVLDVLGRLCGDADGRDVLAVLDRWAPTWLLQMPALLDRERAEALHHRVPSPNRDRMLRELGEALEALSRDRSLVLVLEDLHWSDDSTVDALAYVAQRTTSARLLIVGTYRPVDLVVGAHPLKAMKQSLIARGRGVELPLELLARGDVGAYLTQRLTGNPIDDALVAEVHRRTEGNPLFLTATIDYLLERRLVAVVGGQWRMAARLDGTVPASLRQLVERQLDALEEPTRRVLEAASVVGIAFTGATVAAATGLDAGAVEAECSRLAERGQLVCTAGVAAWPDGTMSGTYEFLHAVYRAVLYSHLAPARRRRLHCAVASRLEAGHSGHLAEVAAVLASHFAEGGNDQQAARYHGEAAAAAKTRFADREVIVHLEAALERLTRLPETRARTEDELGYLLDLAAARLAAHGYASTEAQAAYERARDLAARLELPLAAMVAEGGLLSFHVMRGDLRLARGIAEELVATADRTAVPLFRVLGHTTLGGVLFNLADLPRARAHFDQARAAWEPGFPRLPVDQSVLHLSLGGLTLLHLGRPTEAAVWVGRALDYAAGLDDPFNLSYAHELVAQYHATAGDREAARRHAEASIALATEHGFPGHVAVATITLGWALRDAGTIREGLAAYEVLGQRIATSFFRALLAEVELGEGRVGEAVEVLAAALAFTAETGEHRHLAELHRLRGECVLRAASVNGTRQRRRDPDPTDEEAEACFLRALAVAREQGARLWELRAVTDLARLWGARGRKKEARDLLDGIYEVFTDGVDSPDLTRARELRARL